MHLCPVAKKDGINTLAATVLIQAFGIGDACFPEVKFLSELKSSLECFIALMLRTMRTVKRLSVFATAV